MIVRSTILAIYFLCSHHLRSQTVLMRALVLAVASLDELDADSQEFEVLPLIIEILLEALQEW